MTVWALTYVPKSALPYTSNCCVLDATRREEGVMELPGPWVIWGEL